jgi:hypothetical protein
MTDVSQSVGVLSVLQVHVQGITDQGQTPSGLQQPVCLLEEPWTVEPVCRGHGGHQVYLAVSER